MSEALLDRRLLFVTGKGGVGKSTVAAALALLAAREGKKVLACEFDAKGDLLAALAGAGASGGRQDRPLGYAPRELERGLFAMAMDPEESLKEYLRIHLRLPIVTRIGALSAAFDFLANAAPGVREIVTVGKVAYEVRERHYDLVVVDATSSGHIVSQLRAPQAINELVGTGLIRSQSKWILDLLGDQRQTGVVVVTTPEEMPVNESLDLLDRIAADTAVHVAAMVANRVLPEPFPSTLRRRLTKALSGDGRVAFASRLHDDTAAAPLLDAAELSDSLWRSSVERLDALFDAMAARHVEAVTATVPMLFDVEPGIETTNTVAEHLRAELQP